MEAVEEGGGRRREEEEQLFFEVGCIASLLEYILMGYREVS